MFINGKGTLPQKMIQLLTKLKLFALRLHPQISIQRPCALNLRSKFNLNFGGRIEIGKCCEIHDGALFETNGNNIILGDYCSLNDGVKLLGHGSIKIGNYVRIGPDVKIISFNHKFRDRSIRIINQGLCKKGIVIKDDVWIGANAIILDGVTLGRGSVIGAGSVVTKSTPPYSVCGGNPARLISKRIKD